MSLSELLSASSRSLPSGTLLVEVTDVAPVTVLALAGELDMNTTHLLVDRVDDLVQTSPRGLRLVLDMREVTFFCADGVRALLTVRGILAAAAGQLTLRAPSGSVRRVLDITGDTRRFDIADSIGPR
jgi:anti-sigma B factor antagonist